MKQLFLVLFFGFIGCSCGQLHAQEEASYPLPSTFSAAPKYEVRAVWLTTLSNLDWPSTKATSAYKRQLQQQELCQLLDRLQTAHINTIFLQTRVRGSLLYPSTIEPWDQCLTGVYGKNPGYDPLQFAITEIHRRGMQIHAWIVTIPCFKTTQVKQMPTSILKQNAKLCLKHEGMWYLDPGQPGTADYLCRITREIVSKYDIDGIHLDYIRYPENAQRFPDNATYQRYASAHQSKADWRRSNITRIVRSIYSEVKRLKPWVCVSSSPVGKYADLQRFSSFGWNARDAVFQDAKAWCREGIHDMLCPMMYFDGNHFYPFAVDWQEMTNNRTIAPGLGIYFLDPKEGKWTLNVIRRQLSVTRQLGLGGQSFFRTKYLLKNTKGIYDYLTSTFYPYPAFPPAMTWIDDIAPSEPTVLQTHPLNNSTSLLSWQTATDNLGGGLRYNVYASKDYPVNCNDARNLLAAGLTQTSFQYNHLYTQLYGYYLAVTAMDRCGNESQAAQLSSPQDTLWKHNLKQLPSIFRK